MTGGDKPGLFWRGALLYGKRPEDDNEGRTDGAGSHGIRREMWWAAGLPDATAIRLKQRAAEAGREILVCLIGTGVGNRRSYPFRCCPGIRAP